MIITATTHIKKNIVLKNGKIIYQSETDTEFNDFIKNAFKQLCQPYPKFYKMDKLCKLAFLGAEVLLNDKNLQSTYNKEDIGLVFLNASSTIETDKEHQSTIANKDNYFPSPAIFVYTLPNIMLGEICIRNQFFGENAVYITPQFDAEFLYQQVSLLYEKQRIQACICGWANIEDNHFEAFMMLTENKNVIDNSEEMYNFAPSNIKTLYNT